MITLIVGGARSGKSLVAERLVAKEGLEAWRGESCDDDWDD